MITADENGNFIKADLPSSKYEISVEASGTNIGVHRDNKSGKSGYIDTAHR